jgi:Uma2 family endonuclease
VVWTSGGIDKLDAYRGLGVPEVWFWESSKISVFVLRGGRCHQVEDSEQLPELDLPEFTRFVEHPSQIRGVPEYRALLKRRFGRG